MAIQTVDLTVPNGDTPRSANTKINSNFTDSTHAASKLIGRQPDRVGLNSDVIDGYGQNRVSVTTLTSPDCDLFTVGSIYKNVHASNTLNAPTAAFGSSTYTVYTYLNHDWAAGYSYQVAYPDYTGYDIGSPLFRIVSSGSTFPWRLIGQNSITYNTTTAAGANVVVTATGALQRSTSSERYKDILGDLTLDDATYANAMSLAPIVYRSTAEADNPLHHYYSFSAEELGAFDKAFTFWRETETVTDAEGVITEVVLAEPQAEGLNINAILAFNHAISVKQNSLIADLQEQINALKPA